MSDSTTSPAPAAVEPNQFTLQILSPSLNIPQPLLLTIPITTTVRQLKERIRSLVGTKPPDDAQRLIHRGRLLARDTETMLELFGEEPLRSMDRQTLHLVLRDLSERQTPTPPLIPGQPGVSRSQTPGHQQPQQHHGQSYLRISGHPNIAFGSSHTPGAINGTQLPPGMTQQQLLQNQLQTMARLSLRTPTPHQEHQPGFNPMNPHSMQSPGTTGSTTPGRGGSPFQPETTRTVLREAVGPDGQRWRFTINESIVTSTQRPGRTGSPLSSAEVPASIFPQTRPTSNRGSTGGFDMQNIFRTADAGSATRVMANAMRRNASSSSLANLASHQGQEPIPPGVTTPLIPSRSGSATGTPDPLRAVGRPANGSVGAHTDHTSSTTPEVYILSSPSGPQAVLLNGGQGTYYSPHLRSWQPRGLLLPPVTSSIAQRRSPHTRHEALPQIIARPSIAARNATNSHLNNATPGQQPHPQPQNDAQVPGPMQPHIGHGLNNPQIEAIRIAQVLPHVWPHIWMMVRISLFIWWFTSPTASWLRWITVLSIALILFFVNTGALNPLAEQIWVLLRRHLENLIPLAVDARDGQQQRPGGGVNGANPRGPRDPGPADTAARLVQQRRQDNANWLLNQARRLERAGILFIASLAPGLAERHIAQVEAEARAERQRLQEAEAAAANAPQATSGNTNDNTTTAEPEIHESVPDGDPPGYEAGPSNTTAGHNAATTA